MRPVLRPLERGATDLRRTTTGRAHLRALGPLHVGVEGGWTNPGVSCGLSLGPVGVTCGLVWFDHPRVEALPVHGGHVLRAGPFVVWLWKAPWGPLG